MNWLLLIFFSSLISADIAPEPYKLGEKVADFRMMSTDGKIVSLRDYSSSRGVILTFMANSCQYSWAYESRINRLDSIMKLKDWHVVAVSSNDASVSPEDSYLEMKKRAQTIKYTFPFLYDEDQSLARKFGVTHTPQTFVLENLGKEFRIAYSGAIDDNTWDTTSVKINYIESAVAKLFFKKQPDPAFTKAIGCTIKWKE